MKKFSFNLKALLELREWEEQVARQVFSQSIQEISVLKEKLSLAHAESEAICDDWLKSRSESFTRSERLRLNSAIANAKYTVSELELELTSARVKRDEALSNMKLAARNMKVVANLKQRRLEEYQADALRQETNEIEDIYNARSAERSGL